MDHFYLTMRRTWIFNFVWCLRLTSSTVVHRNIIRSITNSNSHPLLRGYPGYRSYFKHFSSRFLNVEKEKMDKATILFVLGGPGSGKGTLCESLSASFGMRHISAGELLRQEQMSGSKNGDLIDSILREGKIVPASITVDLLLRTIERDCVNYSKFLIDGFPRNRQNEDEWMKSTSSLNEYFTVDGMLFLDCPHEELTKRLLSRGESSGRSDDNIETIKKRLVTFEKDTRPVADIYAAKNKLIPICASLSKAAVFEEASLKLLPIMSPEVLRQSQVVLTLLQTVNEVEFKALCSSEFTFKIYSDSVHDSAPLFPSIGAMRRMLSNDSWEIRLDGNVVNADLLLTGVDGPPMRLSLGWRTNSFGKWKLLYLQFDDRSVQPL